MKQKLKVWVCMGQSIETGKWVPGVWGFKPDDTPYRIAIDQQEVEVEAPDHFNPLPSQVAALHAQKEAEVERHAERLKDINQQLSKLQAIEHTP